MLVTYNSLQLQLADFDEFLAWLATCEWAGKWSATMESSLRSEDAGRLHIHCFLEFARPVDWQSCTALRFKGIQPNLSPCRARGARWRDAADQGHFYVWAAKVHLRWVTLQRHSISC